MNCALLSNVNIESVSRRVESHHVYVPRGYGTWTQELADPSSGTWSFGPSAIFLVMDGAELLRGEGPDTALAEFDGHLAWIERASERAPGVKFFVSTVDIPAQAPHTLKDGHIERRLEQHWQAGVSRLIADRANVYVLDLKGLVENVGRAQFYSNKRWYLGGLRFSVIGEKLIAKELGRILDAQTVARKKCLLLDLDNTLWGGIIGEDGLNGIQLSETGEGARYKDFQRRIRRLGEMGVILGIVSKNNEEDVFEVFESHEHMILKRGDFATLKIDWSPKPQSIASVAQDLDLGLDSLVFIDDNPVEREAVRTALPEVTVPEFPADTCELPGFLEQVYKDCFFTLESTEEDRARTATYLANARRAAERSATASIDEFLAALRTKISLGKMREDDIPRAVQLTQKTNQFNLTTRRYTEQELRAFQTTPGTAVFIASVADKFGDNGKEFLGIVRKLSAETAELDSFLMSCRVMGRFIEDQLLGYLVEELRGDGVSKLRVPFIPSKKNTPARAFVDRLNGGRLVSNDASGAMTWEFDITRTSPITHASYAELLTPLSAALVTRDQAV
jgi:FkbH-like protein